MITPFFSVIIPTYNRAKLLHESVQSVLNQTYKDYELIVVDDDSKDDTREIVESFCDYRIKYIMNDHKKGGAGARNAGLFRAKGEWIAFLDDDDIWLPHKLELQYETINGLDNSVGIIYGGCAIYDFDKKIEILSRMPEKDGWMLKDLLYENCIASFGSLAVRKDILFKVNGFDESFPALQDWELYIRITGISKVVSIKEKLYYIRKSNPDRISLCPEKRLKGMLFFHRKYNHLLKDNPRHSHHIASKIFIYSLRVKSWSIALRHIPWTLAGIFFSPYNLIKTVWGVFLILANSERIGNKISN